MNQFDDDLEAKETRVGPTIFSLFEQYQGNKGLLNRDMLKEFEREERQHQAKQNRDMLNILKVQNIYYLCYNFNKNQINFNQNFIKTIFYYNLCALTQ